MTREMGGTSAGSCGFVSRLWGSVPSGTGSIQGVTSPDGAGIEDLVQEPSAASMLPVLDVIQET